MCHVFLYIPTYIISQFYIFHLQPVCLATFSKVRSISYSAESDGRALLTVHIEGAKQVTLKLKMFLKKAFTFVLEISPLMGGVTFWSLKVTAFFNIGQGHCGGFSLVKRTLHFTCNKCALTC